MLAQFGEVGAIVEKAADAIGGVPGAVAKRSGAIGRDDGWRAVAGESAARAVMCSPVRPVGVFDARGGVLAATAGEKLLSAPSAKRF